MNPGPGQTESPTRRRLLWPWLLLAAALLAAVPAAWWMKQEVARARLLREHNANVQVTNTPSAVQGPEP